MTYETAAEHHNRRAFPKGHYHYDGEGINYNGEPILTLNRPTHDDDNRRDNNRDRMGHQLAGYCHEAGRLYVDSWSHGKPHVSHRHPRIFLTLDQSELQEFPEQVMVLEIKRQDGKTARFHLSISGTDTKCKAELYSQSKSEYADDARVTRRGRYVDYDANHD